MNEAWSKDTHERQQKLARIQQALTRDKDKALPQWYVNSEEQTMVVIPGPVEFLMGSPASEAGREGGPEGRVEAQHRKRLGRSYAIAAKEVTVAQFLKFRSDYGYSKQYAPKPDCPMNQVTWYAAAEYCNWLSKQEGIPSDQWCYLPDSVGRFQQGMKLAPNYLQLQGYRLPSEAEWEYACRAGAITSRYYGETEELLGKYAWYTKTSLDRWTLAAGSLKPNDLGLFDMLGNDLEWCQEQIVYYSLGQGGKTNADVEDNKDIRDTQSRVLRGGSFFTHAVLVRCANRNWYVPPNRNFDVGFRPARTFTAE